jgi:hypothetical protein
MALLVLYSLEDKQMKGFELVPEVHNQPIRYKYFLKLEAR